MSTVSYVTLLTLGMCALAVYVIIVCDRIDRVEDRVDRLEGR